MAQRKCYQESCYVNTETPPGMHTHADKNIHLQIFSTEVRSQQIISFNSTLWIDFCSFPIHSESTIFFMSSWSWITFCQGWGDVAGRLLIRQDHGRHKQVADAAALNQSQSGLNHQIYPCLPWYIDSTAFVSPFPSIAEFLTNPVPGYWAIIKNVWQDLRAVRDDFGEAGMAGEDGIMQCGSTWQRDLRPWLLSKPPWNFRLWSLFEKLLK